jgi:hypothetical protein
VARQDHAGGADERQRPGGVDVLEPDLERVVVERLDPLDHRIAVDGHRADLGIGDVGVGEDHVVGRERLTVGPLHVLPELPGD